MNGKTAVFTAIGLVLGLLAGLALGSSLGGDPAPAPAPVADLHQPSDRNDAPMPSHQDEAKPVPAHEPGETSLNDVIAGIDAPPVPKGEGVISGRVLADTGEPVPGVKISGRARYPAKRYTAGATLEERVRDNIRYERWRETSEHAATTDENGNYKLTGLSEKETYAIWAVLDGWRFSAIQQSGRVEPGQTCDYAGVSIYTLPVEVRMPDGSLASPSWISIQSADNKRHSNSEQLDTGVGEIVLESGEWKLTAGAGKQREYSSDELVVLAERGAKMKPVVLTLKGRPGITGTVTVPDVFVGQRARVFVVKDPPADAPVDLNAIRRARPRQEYVSFGDREGVRSTRGEFAVLDIEPGVYRVILDHDNEIADWRDVTVTNDLVHVALTVAEPDRLKYFVVRILSPDGEFLADSHATLAIHHAHGRQSGGGQRATQDADAIWVKRAEPSSRGSGELPEDWWYELSATHEQYGTIKRRVERDAPADQEFRFSAPGTVILTVAGYNEHELRSSLNWSLVEPGQQGAVRSGIDMREGDADTNKSPLKFGAMQPGAYDLVLALSGSSQWRELYRQGVTIAPGENALTASLPALYSLKVRCADAAEARRLRLLSDGRRLSSNGEEMEGAVVEFRYLPAGDYELQGTAGRMSVTVPSIGTIEFAPRQYDCLVLSDIKEGGLIEGLGLRNGDKLYDIDGEPIGDMKLFEARLMLSLARESTTWKVLRDGIPTDVTFSGKALMDVMANKRDNKEDLDFDPGFQRD